MSLDSDVLAIPGLVSYWKLTDRTGTNAPDSGPANMPITLINPANGVALTTGGGLSLRGNGTNVRGATATLDSGHPLRFAAGAPFTIAGWVAPGTPSGTKTFFGRNNNQSIRYNGVGSPTAVGPTLTLSGYGPLTVGEPLFLTVASDGRELFYFVNGILDNTAPCTTPTADTADPFEVLSIGQTDGTCANADIERVFAVGRLMGGGELRALYLTGAATPVVLGAATILDVQDTTAEVLSSSPSVRCFSCTGQMRTNETNILIGVNRRHAACYGGRRRSTAVTVPVVASPTMTHSDVGAAAARTLFDQLFIRAARPTVNRPSYFDGVNWVYVAGTAPTEVCGQAAGAATLYRLAGVDRDSWLLRLATATVEQYIGTQETFHPPGSGAYAGAYGVADPGPTMALSAHYAMETYLLLKDVLSAGTRMRWLDSFVKAGAYWKATEKGYYTNGNIECGELLNTYLLYRVTGDATWLTEYEYQLAKVANPAGLGNVTGVNATFGWVQSVAAVAADGSDGQGYFGESKNNGSSAPGFDAIYAGVQLGFLTRLHEWNGDARLLKYINGLANKLLAYVNTTSSNITGPNGQTLVPWRMDSLNGSRNNSLRPYTSHAFFYLSRNPALRSTNPWTVSAASQWAATETEFRNNRHVFGYFARAMGEELGPWVRSSPIWPGNPAL